VQLEENRRSPYAAGTVLAPRSRALTPAAARNAPARSRYRPDRDRRFRLDVDDRGITWITSRAPTWRKRVRRRSHPQLARSWGESTPHRARSSSERARLLRRARTSNGCAACRFSLSENVAARARWPQMFAGSTSCQCRSSRAAGRAIGGGSVSVAVAESRSLRRGGLCFHRGAARILPRSCRRTSCADRLRARDGALHDGIRFDSRRAYESAWGVRRGAGEARREDRLLSRRDRRRRSTRGERREASGARIEGRPVAEVRRRTVSASPASAVRMKARGHARVPRKSQAEVVTTSSSRPRGDRAPHLRTARRMNMTTVAGLLRRRRERAVRARGRRAPAHSVRAGGRVVPRHRARHPRAAREAGADSVHPGYGFLARIAGVRDAVRDRVCASSARTGGARPRSAQVHRSARPPRAGAVLPATWRTTSATTRSSRPRPASATRHVKPVAGRRGIGMERVRRAAKLQAALGGAAHRAASFGDERLMLEKARRAPAARRGADPRRHARADLRARGARTGSTSGDQRFSRRRPRRRSRTRSGKRSPSRGRSRAGEVHERGTAEFIVDAKAASRFLEVNARLQVEHPVNRAGWDIDLVEQQLRVALGERLSLGEPAPRDTRYEARLTGGRGGGSSPRPPHRAHRWPEGIRSMRLRGRARRHAPLHPLIAKLIAHGPHRKSRSGSSARRSRRWRCSGAHDCAFLRALDRALQDPKGGRHRVREGAPEARYVP